MSTPPSQLLAPGLDALARWRAALTQQLAGLQRLGAEHGLLDDVGGAELAALRERLQTHRLVLAFVAEFSRGKSELINAIFFADAGRRVLPAAPGRTTMCPVELRWDAGAPSALSLLPIQTRLQPLTLAQWREREAEWQQVPLPQDDAPALAQALAAVTQTVDVSVDEARALGLWHDERPEDNPPQGPDGRVQVPAWRHAVIRWPHPLLQRGLVVLDTPGLNAIGAEPELTLGLLPAAHAVVFVLAADTGVTRSDLALWREHLGGGALQHFVALNKVDTLADPLAPADQAATLLAAHVQRQRDDCAQALGLPVARVYPLSARQALAARVAGDDAALAASGVASLEAALAAQLLPQRAQLLAQAAAEGLQRLGEAGLRRLADRRRQQAEELMELRGLRGRSAGKLRLLLARVASEAQEFERCTTRLVALRAVQRRLHQRIQERLSGQMLRAEMAAMQAAMASGLLHLGARPAFDALLSRLRASLQAAQADVDEMQQMLAAGYAQLNAEHGFALTLAPLPEMQRYLGELDAVARSYGSHLSLTQGWRLALPTAAEQFRRMLHARLRMVFERAESELSAWQQSATAQVELQLRDRRQAFVRRRETLERVQQASEGLEQRIREVQAQDDHLQQLRAQWQAALDDALALAQRDAAPAGACAAGLAPRPEVHARSRDAA
jgi:hypothetical protein